MIIAVILWLVAFICAILVYSNTMKLEHSTDEFLESIRQIRQSYGEDMRTFSVPEYYERMEKQYLELQAEKESQPKYNIILWWGLDGLRLNDDGGFEWIRKNAKDSSIQRGSIDSEKFWEQVQATKQKIRSLQPAESEISLNDVFDIPKSDVNKRIEKLTQLIWKLEREIEHTKSDEKRLEKSSALELAYKMRLFATCERDEQDKKQRELAQLAQTIQSLQSAQMAQTQHIIQALHSAPYPAYFPYYAHCIASKYTPHMWTVPPQVFNQLQYQSGFICKREGNNAETSG